MSLQQSFDDPHRPTTDTTVRVFPNIAPTPRSPEPTWWNNPAAIALIGMPLSVGLTWLPWLPPILGVVAMLSSLVVAVCAAVAHLTWPESHVKALAEGAWVARQCGYQAAVSGHELHWMDGDDTIKHATVVRGSTGWDLILTDQNTSISVD